MQKYNPAEIEAKWQKTWDEQGTYSADLASAKPKYIAMSMFNYPSGAGIHIGHAMNYTISDVKARFMRQLGYESYHPVGWDAFGLPAENYAIKAGVSPQESMAKIIPSYHKQYKAMGWSNDWNREISTHEPEYYKWTQWIFLQMLKEGLAYQDTREQWWCEKCQTVLANEQVLEGKCWRHDSTTDEQVQKKQVKQWFFKITAYAEQLLSAIDGLEWTQSVKLAQKNWIGRSRGASIKFKVESSKDEIEVFTTRPDTLFGATYVVLAPEHPLVGKLTVESEKSKVESYIKEAVKKSDIDRQASKEKTGVFSGSYATNPISGEKIPVWVADYVLVGYGTGAIMAVPAHDERDYEFAKQFDLPITTVINPAEGRYLIIEKSISLEASKKLSDFGNISVESVSKDWGKFWRISVPAAKEPEFRKFLENSLLEKEDGGWYTDSMGTTNWVVFKGKSIQVLNEVDYEKFVQICQEIRIPKEQLDIAKPASWAGEGVMVNSGEYDGMDSAQAREKIVADLAKKGVAKEKTNYKMRDWSVSRQRYWGAPIPMIDCPKCGPVPVPEKDLPVVLPVLDDFQPSGDGRSALARAKDWLKVPCPTCGGDAERETDTLDTYIDSSWYMYRYFDAHNNEQIFDPSVVKKWEPIDFYNGADHATAHLLYARFIGYFFQKLGLVDEPEPFKQFLFNGKVTASDGSMFSKSKGNGVDPLDIIEQGYGADALRTYLMFASPLEQWTAWEAKGVPGAYRFITRVWNLVNEYQEAEKGSLKDKTSAELLRATHAMIKKVTGDLEHNDYNTAIASMMACTNEFYRLKETELFKCSDWQFALESLVVCMAPFTPHASEELWYKLGKTTTVHKDTWPKWEEKYLQSDTLTIVVQVNGKLRATLEEVPGSSSEQEIVAKAKENSKVAPYLADSEVVQTVYVPGKLVNFVVR